MSTTSNKNAGEGMSLGSALEFFTISTATDITPAAAPSKDADIPASQAVLNKIIETISLNGQPVIIDVSGTGPYVLKFAVEHKGGQDVTALQVAVRAITGDNAATVVASSL